MAQGLFFETPTHFVNNHGIIDFLRFPEFCWKLQEITHPAYNYRKIAGQMQIRRKIIGKLQENIISGNLPRIFVKFYDFLQNCINPGSVIFCNFLVFYRKHRKHPLRPESPITILDLWWARLAWQRFSGNPISYGILRESRNSGMMRKLAEH